MKAHLIYKGSCQINAGFGWEIKNVWKQEMYSGD